MSPVIWFNDGLSVIAEMAQSLRSVFLSGATVIITHKNPHFIGFNYADIAQVEGSYDSAQDYVEAALAFAIKHGVTHFFVGRHAKAISAQAQRFADKGVKLMFSLPAHQWDNVDDKGLFYQALTKAGHQDMLPHYHLWSDQQPDLFADLVQRIKALPGHPAACVKPVRGIFGQGFFQFSDSPCPEQQLFFPDQKVIKPEVFLDLALQSASQRQHQRTWMLMEFLSGPEYSVDTLAYQGKLISHVAREKGKIDSHGQMIVNDPQLKAYLQALASTFELSGVFNAQFRRDIHGNLKVMEINPRFSGGAGLSLLAGVDLPYWWMRLVDTQGMCAHTVPQSTAGLRVYSWHHAVSLPNLKNKARNDI